MEKLPVNHSLHDYGSVCATVDGLCTKDAAKDFLTRAGVVFTDMMRVLKSVSSKDREYAMVCNLINWYLWEFIQDERYYLMDDVGHGASVLKQKILGFTADDSNRKSMLECYSLFEEILFGIFLLTENDAGVPEEQYQLVEGYLGSFCKNVENI